MLQRIHKKTDTEQVCTAQIWTAVIATSISAVLSILDSNTTRNKTLCDLIITILSVGVFSVLFIYVTAT